MSGNDQAGAALVATDPRLALLDDRELSALSYFQAGRGPCISDVTIDAMYKLFLRGLTCEDIRVLNPGFGLGPIVDARVRGRWDERRAEHDAAQVTEGAAAIRRAQLDAALLAGDYIAATAAMHRPRIHRYLQTGDEKHLDGVPVGSLNELRGALDALLKATRQDGPGKGARPPDDPLPPASATPAPPAATPGGARLLQIAADRRAMPRG